MPSTTVAMGTFANRKAANQAVRRLISDGFARNSIEVLEREDDDGFDLTVHTRRENLARARRLIHDRSRYSLEEAAATTADVARTHPILVLGAGILAGFALYTLFSASVSPEPSHRAHARDRGGRR